MNESPGVMVDWLTGHLGGEAVRTSQKTLGDLWGIFRDQETARRMDGGTIVYRVEYWLPVEEGTPGGLCWGTTVIEPGIVGDEYFMTHGHFHSIRDRAEFYGTVQGRGALILMDENGKTWMESMQPGSLHYVSGRVAHRIANTGSTPLRVAACWPSDAGHDYDEIRQHGFGARLREINGNATLVPQTSAPLREARPRGMVFSTGRHSATKN